MKSLVLPAAALLAGVAHALSFAPFNWPRLQLIALATLFALSARAAGWRLAALLGFAFGLGWFGVGVSWVYISMHRYGLMPAPLAAAATLAFCAFLALYPALALGAAQRAVPVAGLRLALMLPALWTELRVLRDVGLHETNRYRGTDGLGIPLAVQHGTGTDHRDHGAGDPRVAAPAARAQRQR